jgi:hypothetical protein
VMAGKVFCKAITRPFVNFLSTVKSSSSGSWHNEAIVWETVPYSIRFFALSKISWKSKFPKPTYSWNSR